MKINFSKTYPGEEGQYLIHWKMFNRFELITVVYVPPVFQYGVQWDGYLSISEWRNKSVYHINIDMVIGISNKLDNYVNACAGMA